MKTHYEILGVPFIAKADEISAAFRKLATTSHPDKSNWGEFPGIDENFGKVTEAYNVLKNPERRKKYNMELRFKYINCMRCKGTGKTYTQKGFTGKTYGECPDCNGLGLKEKP